MATHAMAEPAQSPTSGAAAKAKSGTPLARRRMTIARTGTRGSIHNADEVQEAVRRARSIKISDCPVAHGKSISDTLLEITHDLSERLKDHYRLPWEKDGAEEEAKMLVEADRQVSEHDSKEMDSAAVKIQSMLRRKSAAKESHARKSMKARQSAGQFAMKSDSMSSPKDKVIKSRSFSHKDHVQSLKAKEDWQPEEVNAAIQELLSNLNTDEVEGSLDYINDGLQARVQEERDTENYCAWLEAQSQKVLEGAASCHAETLQKLEGADAKSSTAIKAVFEQGDKMIELGKKAAVERDRLFQKLQADKRLHLGQPERDKLEEKKQLVYQLGCRLMEVRAAEETDAQNAGGRQEHANKKIVELNAWIQKSAERKNGLTQTFGTIEKFVRTCELTYDYLDNNKQNQLPEEGILETLDEAKSIVRETTLLPRMWEQDELHADKLEAPDMSEVVTLEAEVSRLQTMLTDVEKRIAALSTPANHNETVVSGLGLAGCPYGTPSGMLEPTALPVVTPESSHVMKEALLAQIHLTYDQLAPGLKQLSRFEKLLHNAQNTLNLFASQREVFVGHVRSVKENLVREAEDLAEGLAGAAMNRQERLRQTMQALHDAEFSLCGGVEEENARLDFARELVSDQLSKAGRLRKLYDRNRWAMDDMIGFHVESLTTKAEPDPSLASFRQDDVTLVENAARVRRERWEQELSERRETGRKAATTASEAQATKAAIAAVVEAEEAPEDDTFSDRGDFEASDEEQDEEGTKNQSRGGVKFDADFTHVSVEGKEVSAKRRPTGQTIGSPMLKSRGQRNRRAPGANSLAVAAGPPLDLIDETADESISASPPSAPDSTKPSARSSLDKTKDSRAASRPGSRASTLAAPELPPMVRSAADIVAMHQTNLKLGGNIEEAQSAYKTLASRIGGNPLEPSRCDALVGDAKEKENIKTRMEEMMENKKRWWSSRQLVTLDPEPHEPVTEKKEAEAHAAAMSRLQRAIKGDMAWVGEDAAVKLQAAHRGLAVRKQKKKEISAVTVMQKLARGHAARVKTTTKKQVAMAAAVKIQSVARGNKARKEAKGNGFVATVRVARAKASGPSLPMSSRLSMPAMPSLMNSITPVRSSMPALFPRRVSQTVQEPRVSSDAETTPQETITLNPEMLASRGWESLFGRAATEPQSGIEGTRRSTLSQGVSGIVVNKATAEAEKMMEYLRTHKSRDNVEVTGVVEGTPRRPSHFRLDTGAVEETPQGSSHFDVASFGDAVGASPAAHSAFPMTVATPRRLSSTALPRNPRASLPSPSSRTSLPISSSRTSLPLTIVPRRLASQAAVAAVERSPSQMSDSSVLSSRPSLEEFAAGRRAASAAGSHSKEELAERITEVEDADGEFVEKVTATETM